MKKTAENKFAVLGSRVMQCGVREVRRQEVVKSEVKCFGCGKEGHRKWECPQKKERQRGKRMERKGSAKWKSRKSCV